MFGNRQLCFIVEDTVEHVSRALEPAGFDVVRLGVSRDPEALVAGRPLVIAPRATHKVEQQIRAETLAAHGLARWVHPRELSGTTLARALEWALCCDRDAHARRVREILPPFDGVARLTDYLSQWLG